MKLNLLLENDKLLLEGVHATPLLVDSIKHRFEQAKNNISQTNWAHFPIFVGCEHLAYLPQTDQPYLVIEKSPEYYELLINHGLIQRTKVNGPILGDLGFAPATLHPNLSFGFLEQDLLKITSSLLNQTLQAKKALNFFWIESEDPNNIFDRYLHRALLTTQYILEQHKKYLPLYQELHKNQHSGILGLHRNTADLASIQIIGEHQNYFKPSYYSLDYQSSNNDIFLIFKGKQWLKDEVTTDQLTLWLKEPLSRHDNLIQHLIRVRPELVIQRNKSIYGSLEDYLLLQPLWQLCGIKEFCFWIDYQQHRFDGFEGGFLGSIKNDTATNLTFYPLDQSKSDSQFYYYQHPVQKVIAPKQASQFNQDIVIMHHTRKNAFSLEPMNLIFRLLTDFSTYPLQITYFVFFDVLENFLKNPPPPFKKTGFWFNLMHRMHFACYHQLRATWVKQALELLSPYFSMKVYGSSWRGIIADEFLEPDTPNPEAVYAQSLITLDLTPNNSFENPPLAAIRSLQSGGLPVLSAPAYNSMTGQSFFNKDSFLYFQKMESLIDIINELKNKPEKREQWRQLSNLESLRPKSLWNPAELIALKRIKMPELSFTGSPLKDKYILNCALAVLLELSGYYEHALELLRETQESLNIVHHLVTVHAKNLAQKEKLSNQIDYWTHINNQITP